MSVDAEGSLSHEVLQTRVEGGIAHLILNRPEALNALNRALLVALGEAIEWARADDSVRAIIIQGSGPRAFVAGADIRELAGLSGLEALEVSRLGQQLFLTIERLRKPVVAAVHGFALGGGCELALACHLRIASTYARFGLPEVGLGILPGYGGTIRLPRLIGKGRALEMILSGDPIDAEEAERIGLVNRVVEPEELIPAAIELLERILVRGPLAIAAAIESVNRGMECEVEAGLALEASLFGVLASTADMREGMAAFLEKRPPHFEGR